MVANHTHHEFPMHETLPSKLKNILTDRLQPDTYEYNNLLLLDDAVDDDEDDDGFMDELLGGKILFVFNRATGLKRNFNALTKQSYSR